VRLERPGAQRGRGGRPRRLHHEAALAVEKMHCVPDAVILHRHDAGEAVAVLLQHRERLQQLLTGMADDPKGEGILEALKFSGWEVVDDEDMEFMIDLMDTLET